jgi:hypothetical protein
LDREIITIEALEIVGQARQIARYVSVVAIRVVVGPDLDADAAPSASVSGLGRARAVGLDDVFLVAQCDLAQVIRGAVVDALDDLVALGARLRLLEVDRHFDHLRESERSQPVVLVAFAGLSLANDVEEWNAGGADAQRLRQLELLQRVLAREHGGGRGRCGRCGCCGRCARQSGPHLCGDGARRGGSREGKE